MASADLWTAQHDAAVAELLAAVREDRLAHALLALQAAPASARAATQTELDRWGEAVAARLGDDGDATAAAAALRVVLVREAGFRGDRDHYSAPVNSQLADVVERRRGQPILLAAVWMEVGRRAGLAVDGVGLPGHFVARIGGDDGVLVDPFGGGGRLNVEQCKRLVEACGGGRVAWDDAMLASVSTTALVERVVRNWMHGMHDADDAVGAYRATRVYHALRPHDAESALLLARVSERVGALRSAASIYREVIEAHPKADVSVIAAHRLAPLLVRIDGLH